MPSAPSGLATVTRASRWPSGRGSPHLIIDEVKEDAHQIITGFLARDREPGLLDDLAERGRRSSKRVGNSPSAMTGKSSRGSVERLKRERLATTSLLSLGGGQFDLTAFGQLADDVEEGVRRDGRRAGLADIRRHRLIDLEIEVRRHQTERTVVARFQQHVGQDGDGVPALHDRLDVAEALQKCRPLNRHFHVAKAPSSAA